MMRVEILKVFCIGCIGLIGFNSPVRAEERDEGDSETEISKPTHPSKKRIKISRDKETEGTQAPNRFDSDLIIKSKYRLNGQDLEVDTD